MGEVRPGFGPDGRLPFATACAHVSAVFSSKLKIGVLCARVKFRLNSGSGKGVAKNHLALRIEGGADLEHDLDDLSVIWGLTLCESLYQPIADQYPGALEAKVCHWDSNVIEGASERIARRKSVPMFGEHAYPDIVNAPAASFDGHLMVVERRECFQVEKVGRRTLSRLNSQNLEFVLSGLKLSQVQSRFELSPSVAINVQRILTHP